MVIEQSLSILHAHLPGAGERGGSGGLESNEFAFRKGDILICDSLSLLRF
jgi:hypothetical protein